MTHAVAQIEPAPARSVLANGHLASLTRTYSAARAPVWVYDLSQRCVYRNPASETASPASPASVRFPIVDHRDEVVGHVVTVFP